MPDFYSGSRFDTATNYVWRSGGAYHHGQGVGAATTTLVTIALSTHGETVRVDYASVNLQFDVTDVAAYAELVLELNDGTDVPFLSCSAYGHNTPGDIPAPIEAVCCQLSLPFIITVPSHIKLRGNSAGFGTSTVAGTVALSRADQIYF